MNTRSPRVISDLLRVCFAAWAEVGLGAERRLSHCNDLEPVETLPAGFARGETLRNLSRIQSRGR